MFLRDTAGSITSLDGKEVNASPAIGTLILGGGGTAFTSASNPSSEVIDGTGVAAPATAAVNFGVTVSAANGTITVNRPGDYEVILNIADFSCGAAVGNVQFDVQKNSAAFGTVDAMSVIRAAATSKAGVSLRKIVRLASGDVIRSIVTGASTGVVTVTEGVLIVRQIKDSMSITNIG